MNGRKSVTPLVQASSKRSSKVIGALSLLLLLAMLLNPIAALSASASFNPQPLSRAISQIEPQDIENLPRPLNLESRLICRQAVEQVYWRHRIWPTENPAPKPDLEQVLPPQALRARVEDELRRSNALAQLWQRPITGSQLQAEIDRMTRSTRQPQVLAEIFAALDHDPYLVAECLARPVLADRLMRSFYAADQRSDQDFDQWWQEQNGRFSTLISTPDYAYHLSAPAQIEAQDDTWTPTPALPEGVFGSTAVWTGIEMIVWGGHTNFGARYNPATDTWTTTATIGAPSPRRLHTAVWSGSEMIVWGGCDQSTEFCDVSSGGRYDPLTDSWTSTDFAGAPAARMNHTAVWTGSQMIVWGGCSVGSSGNNYCNIQRDDGGVYDPAADSWQAMSTAGAPDAREYHRAVWADGVMVIWGGYNLAVTNTGGRYDPVSNTWQPTSTAGAPEARANHSMVWTGSEAIVWGGCDISLCLNNDTYYNTGGRYDPLTDAWTAMDTSGAPEARSNHSAVWTGTEMIVWGGRTNSSSYLDTGSRYNPATDTWTATGTTGVPAGKSDHHAVWTGNEMIVWGGSSEPGMSKSGGRYDPASDTWAPTSTNDPVWAKERHTAVWTGTEMLVWGGSTRGYGEYFGLGTRYDAVTGSWSLMSTVNEPPGRYFHTAVWTGSEMIVWGGQYGTSVYNSGGRYDPLSDSWVDTSTAGAPTERANHVAVWTGSEMLVWGGETYSGYTDTGGRYDPDTNTWTATGTSGAPSGRAYLRGVWSGSEMIVWGGYTETGDTSTGGRYDPISNSWSATSTTGAPTGRHFNSAVWTGSEMIVWGGMSGNLDNGTWYNTGGRYDPVSNTWSATSTTGAPSPRIWHVEVWTGEELIVWGGCSGSTSCPNEVYTGGRYDPSGDSWMSTSLQSAPSERANAAAVWTGAEMIVWGGLAGNVGTYTTTGGFYHVSTIPNTPPLAFPDSYTTNEDLQLSVSAPGVLGNDTDEDGNPLSALLISNPIYGSLELASDGSFTYTPDGEFDGSDGFSYRATDGIALSNIVMVTMTVTAVNDLPVAVEDSYSLDEDTALVVVPPGVLSNDSDVDGDLLTATLESGPSHGTLTLEAGGGFTFTPTQDYFGDDSFTYRASDGITQSTPATVNLTIGPVNDAPLAAYDTAGTQEDTPVSIAVLENDSDSDGPALSITAVGIPGLGTAVISGTSVLYAPAANLYGSDSFTYTVSDGSLQDTALVTVSITPVNDAPLAAGDSYTTSQDTALVLPAPGVLANDSDVDGDALTVILVTQPLHGTLVLNVDGSLIYTADAGYSGADQFTYQVSDGSALSEVIAVNITIEALPPPGTEHNLYLPIVRR